jgi:protein TonB
MMAFSFLLHLLAAAIITYSPQQRGGGIPFANLDMLLQEEANNTLPSPSASQTTTTKTEVPKQVDKPSEYDTLNDKVRDAVATAQANPNAMEKASIGLGMTNGYFSSLGEGDTLREDIKEYYLQLLSEVNGKWWLAKAGYGAPARTVVVNMLIARNGEIVDIKMIQGSGSRNDDQALMKSLAQASPLPPLPKTYNGELFVAPIRFNAPLNLISPMKMG